MHVSNMKRDNGNVIPNQFIIEDDEGNLFFQSYDVVVAKIQAKGEWAWLDRDKWNYSPTTARYRNQFLRLTTKETEQKIASGEIILIDLN